MSGFQQKIFHEMEKKNQENLTITWRKMQATETAWRKDRCLI